jgi:CobQ-like glutamine amidotransferase family enzyme
LTTVCAGLQILGEYTQDRAGVRHPGLELLDAVTRPQRVRAIGEVLTSSLISGLGLISGFENHLGGTTLGPQARPLGEVRYGVGNGRPLGDGDAAHPAMPTGTDGAVQGRIVATYLHGPALARNPALADHMLGLALGTELAPLDLPAVAALRADRIGARRRGALRGGILNGRKLANQLRAAAGPAQTWPPPSGPLHA